MNETNALTPFSGRIKQVAMTLASSKWVVVYYAACLAIAPCILLAFHPSSAPRLGDYLGPLVIFPMLLLQVPIALYHLRSKQWFVRPEARLIPGYQRPHFSLLAAMLLLHYLVIPLLIFARLNLDLIGGAAFTIGIASFALMGVDKKVYFFVVLLFVGSLYPPATRDFWFNSDLPYLVPRILLLIAGWCLTAYWIRQQATLHEEADGYQIPRTATAWGSSNRRQRTDQNQRTAKTLNRNKIYGQLADLSLDRFLGRKNKPFHQLIGSGLSAGPLPQAVMTALMMNSMFIAMIVTLQLWSPGTGKAMIWQLAMFTLMMPGITNQQLWTIKRPLMASELLRPNHRHDYFNALFYKSLINTLWSMLIHLLGTIGTLVWLATEWVTFENIAWLVTAAVVSNLLFTSFSLWGTTFKSRILRKMVPMSPLLIGVVAYISHVAWRGGRPSSWVDGIPSDTIVPLLLALVGSFALSLVMLRFAYRKWMRTELG